MTASNDLLSTDEATALVVRLLDGAIRAEMFLLDGRGSRDGKPELVARLTVDPDIAFAALRASGGTEETR